MPASEEVILTKIVATIGPACAKPTTLVRMIEEGVRVFRINFSHGNFDRFAQYVAAVRQASRTAQIPVGVLCDLSGPKLRVLGIKDDRLTLHSGDQVRFVSKSIEGFRDPETRQVTLATTYPAMADEVKPGDRVLINDGAIRMLVTQRLTSGSQAMLLCSVTRGGVVSSNKGINLPDTHISAPSLTNYDLQCVDWAVEQEIDFLALSFVRDPEDVSQLRSLLAGKQPRGSRIIPIIAKIETPQAVAAIERITEVSDGIMVARGDLGVELDVAEVPVAQKRIIKASHNYGKPVIVATQMLQTMIEEPMPTRAEVSDVANAILDGADALMLSGETAVGKYPVRTVAAMAHTAKITETYAIAQRQGVGKPPRKLQESGYRTAALAHGVSVAAVDLGCKYVVMWSQRGGGARYLSQNRLPVPIIAVSSNEAALRRMGLLFGVRPMWMTPPASTADFVHEIDQLLITRGWAQPGDPLVIMCGEPLGTHGVTNQILIHYLGGVCRLK